MDEPEDNTDTVAAALARARALYSDALTPDSTGLIRQILREVIANPGRLDRRRIAECWAFLADVSTCDYLNRWNEVGPAELDAAEAAVANAFDIIPDLPWGHYVTGFIGRARGDHQAALAAFAKTLELDPRFTRAYAQKANELINVGRPHAAPALVLQAIERLAPGSLALGMFYWIAGRAYFFMGQPQEAVDWFSKSVEIRKNLWYNRLYLVSSLALTGDVAAAWAALRDFAHAFPDYSMARVVLNEQANPNDHPLVLAAREKFHQGLRLAGMSE